MGPWGAAALALAPWLGLILLGCQAAPELPAEVVRPVADFRAEAWTVPAGQAVDFRDQSWPGSKRIARWRWDFGDGQTAGGEAVTHAFERAGQFTVSLELEFEDSGRTSAQHAVTVVEEMATPAPGGRLLLEPVGPGSRFRIVDPTNREAAITLWGPELTSFPKLDEGLTELATGNIPWKHDDATGVLSFRLERPEADLDVYFIPGEGVVQCRYTITPKVPAAEAPASAFLAPCLSMAGGIFDGGHAEFLGRTYYLAEVEGARTWQRVSDCAEAGIRNIFWFDRSHPPQPIPGSATRHIISPPPVAPLLAVESRDGEWVAATTVPGEQCFMFCNSLPGFRCIHTSPPIEFKGGAPGTGIATIFLFRGTREMLLERVTALAH